MQNAQRTDTNITYRRGVLLQLIKFFEVVTSQFHLFPFEDVTV